MPGIPNTELIIKVEGFKDKYTPVYFFVKYKTKNTILPKSVLQNKNLNAFLLRAAKIKTVKTKIKHIAKQKYIINFIKSPIDYMKFIVI